MRSIWRHSVALLFLGLCVSVQSVPLINSSFENGTAGYWISDPSKVCIDASVSSHGIQSLCINGYTNKGVDIVCFIPYETNRIWKVTYDIKKEGDRTLALEVFLQDKKPIGFWVPHGNSNSMIRLVVSKGDWQTETFEFGPVPPEYAGRKVRKIGIYFRMAKSKERGRIWIDNISISNSVAPQQPIDEDIKFNLPDPVQIFDVVPDLSVQAVGDTTDMELRVCLKDFRNEIVADMMGTANNPLKIQVPGNGYYEVVAELLDHGKVVKERQTSFVLTAPLPDDYYDTPYPAFGVWGGLTPAMRRLGGAKWTRRLFFTHFQNGETKAEFPTAEEIKNREPVKVIYCLNVLNPFKRMTPVAEAAWPTLKEKVRKHIINQKGLVDVWETQNEPMVGENFFGTMADVVNIISNTSDVVRDIDPDTPIAGICINPMSKGQYSQYLGYYRNYGIDRYIDAVMLHPYIPNATDPDSSGYVQTINSLGAQLKNIAGHDVPLYISEIGYSTQPGGEVTELQQGAYLARVVLLNRQISALRACVWHIGLWNDATSMRELCFGILRKYPKGSLLREPKPAFAAWATVSRMTYNAEYIRELEMGRGVKVLLFKRDNKPLLVAYSLSPSFQHLKIPLGVTNAILTDMCGTVRIKDCPDSILTFGVDEAPVYISGAKWDNFSDSAKFNVLFAPDDIEVFPSKKLFITMTGSVGMWSSEADLTVELPDNWKVQIKKKNNNSWHIDITVPDETSPGEYDCFFKVADEGQFKYVYRKSVLVKPIAELESCNSIRTSDGESIKIKTKRYLKDEEPLFIDILENKTKVLAKGVFMNGSSRVILPVKHITYGKRNDYYARLMLKDGYQWSLKLPEIFPVSIPRASINLDLPLSSWPKGSVYNLNDGIYSKHAIKEDMDIPIGKLYFCWDSNYLYIGARIKDKYHNLSSHKSSLWSGDSLQIGLSIKPEYMIRANNDGIQETTYAEFGVMPVSGNNSWVWASMNRAAMQLHNEVPGLRNRSIRKQDKTIYKIAIPWKTLNVKEPTQGMGLKLSVLVNDRDVGDRHWLEWYSGIVSGKDPAQYGKAILCK